MAPENSILVFDELTTSDRFKVFWGFIWRGFVITVASALGGGIVGGILGGILGLVAHFLGWSIDSIKTGGAILGGIAGVLVGLVLLWQYIRWLFRGKWSGYQLRLVKQYD